jgi:hypothetical protein
MSHIYRFLPWYAHIPLSSKSKQRIEQDDYLRVPGSDGSMAYTTARAESVRRGEAKLKLKGLVDNNSQLFDVFYPSCCTSYQDPILTFGRNWLPAGATAISTSD